MYAELPVIRSASRNQPNKTAKGLSHKFVRFVIVLAFLIVLFTGTAIVSAYAGDGDTSGTLSSHTHNKENRTILVENGDTLWSIAAANKSMGQDIRSYIDDLKKVNRLKSSALMAGQVLQLP